jgi:hypothetical protein
MAGQLAAMVEDTRWQNSWQPWWKVQDGRTVGSHGGRYKMAGQMAAMVEAMWK